MPSTGFLLWNIGERPFEERLSRLIRAHSPDVIVLVEPGTAPSAVPAALAPFAAVHDPGSSIAVFSRMVDTRFRTFSRSARWQILIARQAGMLEFNLVVAHLPSKREATELDQLNAAIGLATDIRDAEADRKHSRTVVVGDLNMNPFETGVAMNRGLHATSTKLVAEWESRAVQRVEYPLFYNPMWAFFGDRTQGPPGSYYRAASHAVNYHWNVYDQVLLRPSLMDTLEDVQILQSDGQESFLTANGIPDATNGSDHLPVYFRLNWDAIRS